MKILIIGGYGVFGGRLAVLVRDLPDLTVLIAGRNRARAEEFCARMDGEARFVPLAMERGEISPVLQEHQPEIVVDASGPFQTYGDDPYAVIRACIDARVHYLDFADGSEFVLGISRFDRQAKKAKVFVLSGVSSFPVLTGAVLDAFSKTMTIHAVEGGIAPSPYAGVGLNVMRAVISYAGGPVKLIRDGRPVSAVGLGESRRCTIAPPGAMPLKNTRFSLVDVPDLQVLPHDYPTLQSIWMGAGPVPEFLLRMLNGLAKARAALGLPSLAPCAPLFYFVLNRMRFGEHRGGMYLKVSGTRNGQNVQRSWHLVAEGDDGPFIPSMAIEAIVRKCMAGDPPEPGARAASKDLDLDAYEKLFEDRAIHSGFRDEARPGESLYRRLLGPAFLRLPETLRRFHDGGQNEVWTGTAAVERGGGLIANGVAGILGFPAAGSDVPVSVTVQRRDGREIWVRQFGSRSFASRQSAGTGRQDGLLIEKFGPFRVALALVVRGERLYLIARNWSFLGVRLPNVLLPDGESYECELDQTFRFNVTIKAPWVGDIVAYRGQLRPLEAPIEVTRR